MNAAETITAAIEKLESERGRAVSGPWTLHFADNFTARVGIDHSSAPTSLTGTMARADAELIVTLHRTIDAQLAILRGALSGYMISAAPWPWKAVALDLARAILGEEAN